MGYLRLVIYTNLRIYSFYTIDIWPNYGFERKTSFHYSLFTSNYSHISTGYMKCLHLIFYHKSLKHKSIWLIECNAIKSKLVLYIEPLITNEFINNELGKWFRRS